MLWELVHWAALIAATGIAFVYFRDMGDVTQAFMNVKRSNMLFAIRHENAMLAGSLIGLGIAMAPYFVIGAGVTWIFAPLAVAILIMIAFPWVWIHVGLRNQQGTATYYSIDEAKNQIRPEDSVIVIENNGVARAHPDYHIKRPHLAGTPDGLGGENVIMTYCIMTHLGLGYKPEISGTPLDLEVIAQHGNNLIMKDMATNEPIQQMYGTRECDGRQAPGMQPWPTFRMTFRGFQKAYPEGVVFLNKLPSFKKNPLLYVFDNIVEGIILWGTVPHHASEDLMFETMDVEDDRLPRKALVWGFTIGGQSAAVTEEFVRENGGLINTRVGGRDVVIAYDTEFESLGVYYNDAVAPVERANFWGESDQGKLARVESVNAGAYWCVWVNYFPETQVNQIGASNRAAADNVAA
jgi:hypothetical protein